MVAEGCHGRGVRNDIYTEPHVVDVIHGQRSTVQCDGAFLCDKTGKGAGGIERKPVGAVFRLNIGNCRNAIDMAGNNMTTKLVAYFKGSFEIDPVAGFPVTQRRL